MKTSPIKRWKAGYVSLMLVLATGSVLTLLTVYAFQRATATMQTQAKVQLRVDYSEKEEAILRSIVAITPNRAIRAMQSGSNTNAASRAPLTWQTIFTESLVLANARTSISPALVSSLNVTGVSKGNAGDSGLATVTNIFKPIPPHNVGVVAEGINQSLGAGYPPLISCADSTTSDRDQYYPIISRLKTYGSLAQADLNSATLNGNGTTAYGLPAAAYPQFNRLEYPQISFGYAKPGEPFVAKRNWWAFTMDVADHDDHLTLLARPPRSFVISIYEIPSQLAISASSFMSLGQFSGGEDWQNVTVQGGVFAGKAEVLGSASFASLSSRRELTLSDDAVIGDPDSPLLDNSNPFKAGAREEYLVNNNSTAGAFFPVSQSSESGRVAFIPINRGSEYFDRFVHAAESNVLSSTSWNNYSIGALQAAMQLDVIAVQSATNNTPTRLRFSYLLSSGARKSETMILDSSFQTTLPDGYVEIVSSEGGSHTFSSTVPVDVAYGLAGGFAFKQGVTGTITFNNNTFGDPLVGTSKKGYWRPRSPFEIKLLGTGQKCVAVYPERIPAFLTTIGAANSTTNNSIVVNVDYSTTGLNDTVKYKPNIPCTVNDYGVILKECANLTGFPTGFSLVSNLRLYIGDDFNIVPGTPPTGYIPTGSYFPPCSLFAPEKRYGVDVDPFSVVLSGQIGSLASENATTAIRPLDSKNMSGTAMAASNITVNLRPIDHPATLPPITMMNWMVVLEERRSEFN